MFQQTMRFDDVYLALVRELMEHGTEEYNSRTNHAVKRLRGGVSFRLDLSDGLLPVPAHRRVYPRTAAAELAWFLSGSRDVRELQPYTRIWDKFVEEDGHTIQAAYGYRWRRHFGRDQINLAIEELRRDPSSRRVNVCAWDPAIDGLGRPSQLNVPCPTNFTLSLADGQLHSSIFLRSSDVFVGLPYDVMGHAMLVKAIAITLDCHPGVLHLTLADAHIYDAQWSAAFDVLAAIGLRVPMRMLDFSIDAIANYPTRYVDSTEVWSRTYHWPELVTRTELVK